MRPGSVTGVLGRLILAAGIVILLFVAYQLWGTGLAESHSQDVLRQQFDALLHRGGQHHPGTTTTTAGGSDLPTVGSPGAAPGDGSPVGVLHIAKIGLDKVIVEGTSTTDLRQGPGHYPGTPLPGQSGNVAIAGHRTTYGAPFYNLDGLKPGDVIRVTTLQGTFRYRVTSSLTVSPDDTSVVATTTTPELTLTTCTPRFSAAQRLVVHAALTSTPVPGTPTHTSPKEANGLAGSQGDWLPALWWGLLTLALAIATGIVSRRRPRLTRWLLYVVGGVLSLGAMFFFFGAVSPLLPASF
ncbi:MAG TPA: class E sortase [Acidimicrobiales bacterium]|nr:class E sortase [Acidimicrobiales bacterium]